MKSCFAKRQQIHRKTLFCFIALLGFSACAAVQRREAAAGASDTPPGHEQPFRIADRYQALVLARRWRWREYDNLETAAARAQIRDRAKAILDFTTPELDPYTGKANLNEFCQSQNLPKPQIREDAEEFYTELSIYSSENFVVGACPSKGAIKTKYIELYCRNSKTLFEIMFFLPDQDGWPENPLVSCW